MQDLMHVTDASRELRLIYVCPEFNPEIMESFELQDELAALAQGADAYTIHNEHDFSSEDPARFLEAAVEAVANNTDAIRDPEVFDVFRSVLKHSASIPGTFMNKVLDSLTSGIQSEIETTIRDIEAGEQAIDSSHRLSLELFGFLLQWFVTTAEHIKGGDGASVAPAPKARRGRGGKAAGARAAKAAAAARMEETWSLQEHLPATLVVISKVLVKLGMYWQKVWQTTTERETFVR
jgi:condensin complex subunit 1